MYTTRELFGKLRRLFEQIDVVNKLDVAVVAFFNDNPGITIKYSQKRYRQMARVIEKGIELMPYDQIPRIMVRYGLSSNIEWGE